MFRIVVLGFCESVRGITLEFDCRLPGSNMLGGRRFSMITATSGIVFVTVALGEISSFSLWARSSGRQIKFLSAPLFEKLALVCIV